MEKNGGRMAKEEDYLTLKVDLNQQGKKIGLNIVIKDGFAVFNFSDPNLALKWYNGDKKDTEGVKVHYSRKINAVVYDYGTKPKEDIKDILVEELRMAGVK